MKFKRFSRSTKLPGTVTCKYGGMVLIVRNSSVHLTCKFRCSDISNCEVVTAWAAGCTWSEAVEMSGSPPGDLARVLSRVLDAMRQFGSLPFAPMRRQDFEMQTRVEHVSRGLDQEIRRLCREATRAINRYPLKDPLSFATVEDDDLDDNNDDDDEIVSDMDSETNRTNFVSSIFNETDEAIAKSQL